MGPASHSPGPGLIASQTGPPVTGGSQTLLSPRGSGSRGDWAGVPTANALPDWGDMCVGMWLQKELRLEGLQSGEGL